MAPEAGNSRVIERFNKGLAGVDDVLKATTSAIRKNASNWQAAKACLDALQQCRHPVTRETVTPNVIIFNALISACEKAGRTDDALQMFADLEEGRLARGVTPNTITYNAVISACGTAGRADDALRMFSHLEEHGPDHGVFPNATTYGAVISACGKAGRADDALRMFAHLEEHGSARNVFPNTMIYNAVISACGKAGRAGDALRMFAHLEKHGPAHGVFPDTITYNAAISACEKAGRADDALRIFAHLEENGPARGAFPDTITYSAAISACEKAGRADDALRMFARLEEHGPARGVYPNTITYNAVISACEKAGKQDAVSELLNKAIASKVFKASLGFDAKLNKLDLHESNVVTIRANSGRERGISSPAAKAIFRRLANEGAINDKTQIVVGHRGGDALKETIEQCMRDQGWVPVHPLGLSGMPNPGALVGSTAAAVARPREGQGSRSRTSLR